MAFAFFRRRQKIVIIIMAILMVSFLIGFQGFQAIFRTEPGEVTVGTARGGAVHVADLQAVGNDLLLLQTYVGMGNFRRALFAPATGDLAFLSIMMNPDERERVLTYTLLLREAERSGVSVSEEDINAFFSRIGLVGAQYEALISTLRAQPNAPITEERFRDAVARWLRVYKQFNQSMVQAPPSLPQVKRAFVDLNEQIDLRLVQIPASRFLDDIAEPTDEQILQHFEKYRTVAPGRVESPDSWGFGYLQPDRVRILYLMLRRDVVERVAEPSEADAVRYYRQHRDEFVKTVEVTVDEDSQTQPATTQATQPATDVVTPRVREERQVQMSLYESMPQIIERLSGQAAQARIDEAISIARTNIDRYVREAAPDAADPYRWAVDEMTLPADDLLQGEVTPKLEDATLSEAVEALADQTEVAAICYPWGAEGDVSIDPDVRVTLVADEPMTLGEALEALTAQILPDAATTAPAGDDDQPLIRWALCQGFGKSLFAVGGRAGLELFPIAVRRTDWLDRQALQADPILGASHVGPEGGQTLGYYAFNATPLVEEGRTGLLEVGDDGPRMYVLDDRRGQLIWRLTGARPEHAPEAPTDEIAEQVARDFRVVQAFDLADDGATELAAAARGQGLEAAAAAAGLEAQTTGLFARKMLGRGQLFQLELMWNDVPGLSAPSLEVRRYLIERAFQLAGSGDDDSAVGHVAVPAMRRAVVMERIDYVPASEALFNNPGEDQAGRVQLTGILSQGRRGDMTREYFSFENVSQRMGFEWAPDEGGEQE